MSSLSIVTITAGNEHLHYHDPNAPDSVELACDGPVAEHIAARLDALDGVRKFVVIYGDLSWSVSVGLDQHLMYGPNVTGNYPAVRAKG